jgi:23S rRNA (uracil1939-C5)-methyltransferase
MTSTTHPTIKLVLEKPVYGGDCLAHAESTHGKPGKAIFVPLTLPGEIVTAHTTEDKRSFAKAELDQILNASPNRITPPCPHFGGCGGCHYQHADYPEQLALKQQILRETLTRASVAIPAGINVLAKDPWTYRNRIRLAFNRAGEYGYRSRRSHTIVPVQECPIAAPWLLMAARQVAVYLAENPGPAPISEMELFTDAGETQLLITLFCEYTVATDTQPWLDALFSALSPQPTGIRFQVADGSLNPPILAASGEPSIHYTAAGFDYRVDHGAFFQVNRWLVDDFVSLATSSHSGDLAWDMYAGVGLFARQLTRAFAQLVAVESAPASGNALQQNLTGTSAQAVSSSTLDYLRRNRQEREPRPDLIILDPPRAGLGDETTSLLNAIGAPAIVYVSCDPTTLARDLRALTLERYRVDNITMVDMFPQTFHIETVVSLSRS